MVEAKNISSGVDIDKLEADFQADPGNFVPLARAFLERKLPQQAIRACKRGLRSNPNAPSGLLALGMAYYQAYDDQNAESVLKKVLRSSPDSAVAHRSLGEIYLDRGQDQKAIAELMRSIEIEPGDRHTRALLESLEEKVPDLKGPDGQPKDYWLPRQLSATKDAPKPLWHTLMQVLVVAAIMVAVIFWYRHHVKIRVQITEHIKAAMALIPRDNFDDLLEAEKSLEAAYALNSDDEKTIVRLAAVGATLWKYHDQNDRKENLKKYLAWMDEEELPNPERFALKALLMVEEGKVQEADKFLTETIERAIKEKDIFLDASIFGARGMAKLQLGQVKECREDFSRAARFSGDSPHYQAAFAEVYLREGNLPRALKYFKDALRQNPAHTFSNLRRAYAFIQSGKGFENAKKILDEFLDGDRHPEKEFSPPMRGMLYLVRAEYALATDNVPDANTWLRKSLETYDKSAEAHNLAGRLAALNKDASKSNAEFGKALQLDPRLPKVYFDRSESMYLLDDKTGAIDKLKEFERHLKPTVAYHIKKGDLYLRNDDLQAALNEFQLAVKVDELSPEARFHVGRCYQAMGDKLGEGKEKLEQKLAFFNDARKWYEESMMLPGGERPEVYRNMGRIYLASEDPNNAMDKLAKAVLMMQKAGERNTKIALVYEDIARVFDYLGGPEGERQAQVYRFKKEGLLKGMTLEEVEKAAAEKIKKDKASKKKRKKRRRRRRR
jgi:tetratricopeptide (TPR) repeat protein